MRLRLAGVGLALALGGAAHAQVAGGLDCSHVLAASPSAPVPQSLRDSCAQQPKGQAYSHAHEQALGQHETKLAALKAAGGAHPSAEQARAIAAEQSRIDALHGARDAHLTTLRGNDQLHRARYGNLTDQQRMNFTRRSGLSGLHQTGLPQHRLPGTPSPIPKGG